MVELKCEIKRNDQWESVNFDTFRSWFGERKLDGLLYYGPVYEFGSEKEIISGHAAYNLYIETHENDGDTAALTL